MDPPPGVYIFSHMKKLYAPSPVYTWIHPPVRICCSALINDEGNFNLHAELLLAPGLLRRYAGP